MLQGGGRVGCRFPGQNQIRPRSRTLAPNPKTCAHPRCPSFQAFQAKKATIARTTIMTAIRVLLVNMAAFRGESREALSRGFLCSYSTLGAAR